jgi:hypothetical protein
MQPRNITHSKGFKIFKTTFSKGSTSKAFKKYIYVNLWSLGCQPCIDELSFIDSLKDYIHKDIDYFFVSSHSDPAVSGFLNRKKISIINFIFINNMLDFISGVFNEIDINGIVFPTHVIMKRNGEILAFYCGSMNSKEEALPVINFINNLP